MARSTKQETRLHQEVLDLVHHYKKLSFDKKNQLVKVIRVIALVVLVHFLHQSILRGIYDRS